MHWSLQIICINSMPASTHRAVRNDLKLSIGFVTFLIARWTRAAPTKRRLTASMPAGKPRLWNAQVKYLNNIVEQDHRAVKRVTKLMLNFKSFRAVKNALAGIERMHMIRKGQLMMKGYNARSFADQFYALAREIRHV